MSGAIGNNDLDPILGRFVSAAEYVVVPLEGTDDGVRLFASGGLSDQAVGGGRPIVLLAGTYNFLSDQTAACDLQCSRGVVLDIAAGKTVNFTGELTGFPVFSGAGTATGNTTVPGQTVLSFGAVGDGVHDDTAAIQAAIDANDDILFPEGVYMTTGAIYALAGKHLHGVGKSKSLIKHAAGTTGAVLWLGNHTEDTPGTIYQGLRHNVHDLGLLMAATSDWGLRCREVAFGNFADLYIGTPGPDTGGGSPVVCTGTPLFVDGTINSLFTNIECHPNDQNGSAISCFVRSSAALDGGAGSGSGAGATSSKFLTCYFHYAGYGLAGTSLNNVTFDQCVIESNGVGVLAQDQYKWRMLDCYYENNLGDGVDVSGIDTRNHATIEIDGGWAQRNTDGGYLKSDGTAGTPFLHVANVDYARLRGVQMEATIPIVQIVKLTGTVGQIDIECNPQCFHVGKQATNVHTLSAAISTVSGSANIGLAWTANGLPIGTVIDLQGATSPLHVVAVNRPFWIVTAKPTADSLTLAPLLFPTAYVANASASGLGGAAISVSWYGQGDWAHVLIPSRVVRLTDCEYSTVKFEAVFNTIADMSGGGQLLLDGQSGLLFDTHTYIIGLQLVTDQPITAPAPSVRYLEPTLTGAGFDTYALALIDHSGDTLATSPVNDILYRAFPGQSLSIKLFMGGDHDEVFPRRETVEVLLAKTRYTTVTEV